MRNAGTTRCFSALLEREHDKRLRLLHRGCYLSHCSVCRRRVSKRGRANARPRIYRSSSGLRGADPKIHPAHPVFSRTPSHITARGSSDARSRTAGASSHSGMRGPSRPSSWWQLVHAAADAPCRASSIWLFHGAAPASSVVAMALLWSGTRRSPRRGRHRSHSTPADRSACRSCGLQDRRRRIRTEHRNRRWPAPGQFLSRSSLGAQA